MRDGAGEGVRRLTPPHGLLQRSRTIRIVLATVHHAPTDDASDLAALCRLCHVRHDGPEHLRRRLTGLARRARGDPFTGPHD